MQNITQNPEVATGTEVGGVVEVQPVLFGSIKELFSIADRLKTVGDYTAANIIWAFVFDWFIGQSNLLENDGERESIRLEYETDFSDPHYDLCVMVYVGENEICGCRFNVPAPLLSKKALCCFFRHGAKVVERMEHGRTREEGEAVDITTFGVVDPGWVLEAGED